MFLGLDLGTNTGYGIGTPDKLPRLGSIVLPSTGDDVGAFLDYMWLWLTAQIRDEPDLDFVLFEAGLLPQPVIVQGRIVHKTNIATTRKLQGLCGVVEMCVTQENRRRKLKRIDREIKCREVYLQTAKKELTGNGRADKDHMVAVAKRCGLNPRTPDEADAFAVWLHGVNLYAPQYKYAWDELVWKGRGGLL